MQGPLSLATWLRSLFAVAVVFASGAVAQCGITWQPGAGGTGVDSEVRSVTSWDPDGTGPLPEQVVIGGYMTVAGDVLVNHIASWDPGTGAWAPLGSGTSDPVFAVSTLANGDLVAGGYLTSAGGQPANGIARWDGVAWSALGGGVDGGVFAMCRMPNGDLIVGGSFANAGGSPASNIARWDGTSWSALGSGVDDDVVSLAVTPNGDLIAGGQFTFAGGSFARYVARWDGAAWSALGTGVGSQVRSVAVTPNGDVYVGGNFFTAGGSAAQRIARWDGSSWHPVGTGCDDWVFELTTLANGDLLASGMFDVAGGVAASRIARWDGASWSALSAEQIVGQVDEVLELPGGDLFVTGLFDHVGSLAARNVALWSQSTWSATNTGTSGVIMTMVPTPDGGVVAGGTFTTIEGVAAKGLAARVGSNWLEVGGGLKLQPGVEPRVWSMAYTSTGELVVGGAFTAAGSIAANSIAKWDGVGWDALGGGFDNVVYAVAVMPGGNIVAAGPFSQAGGVPVAGLAMWDGSSWSAIGGGLTGNLFTPVQGTDVVVMPNGDLVVAGSFDAAGGVPVSGLARWDGTSWSGIPGVPSASAIVGTKLLAHPSGDLYVTGLFFIQTASGIAPYIARWDGAAWHPLGAGLDQPATRMICLPDGDVVASGFFASAGGLSTNGIARWDGNSWTGFGGGVQAANNGGEAYALAFADDGLFVGGRFSAVDGQVSESFATLATSCPAAVSTVAAGCASSAGSNELQVRSLPWAGSTTELRIDPVPSPAIGIHMFAGTTAAQQLASVFPEALPGCALAVEPLAVGLRLTTNGSLVRSVAIPDTAALVGADLFVQVLLVELDASGGIDEITVSSAERLTIGRF